MKNSVKKSTKWMLASLFFAAMFVACETNPVVEPQDDILPAQFRVDIPTTLSNPNAAGGRVSGRAEEVLQGNDIYQHLGTFINVGEFASEVVEDIINGIRTLHIDRVMTLTYQSDDDNRAKNLVVVENPEFEGVVYEFGLTVTDADSEGNQDGGYALQIFWNRSPIAGVAIMKPFNMDRLHDADAGEATFRIDYNSASDLGYDAHMIVSLADLPLEQPSVDPYSMRTLKMFVGKKDNIIDVYGNSNHPNAAFFTADTGFNWAFVASGYNDSDFGVAEVGLPPSTLNETSRAVLLGDYSIYNVFTQQIQIAYPNLSQDLIDLYLMNTAAPGYFTADGFIAGGTPPSGLWTELEERILALAPYNPSEISNLQISFK